MKKVIILISIIISSLQLSIAQHYENGITSGEATFNVLYFENTPFVYEKNGQMSGIEVDILNYFKDWLKKTKNISLTFNYQKQEDFNLLIDGVKNSEDGTIAIGAISTTEERKKKVLFTAPYMKNVSVLVTSGNIETMRTIEDLRNTLPTIQPYTVQGSSHEDYLQNLYSEADLSLEMQYVKHPSEVLTKIKESPRSFGYVDVITFWSYLQSNKEYLKINRIGNVADENFAIALPVSSRWEPIFNEFFESGFGFTATKDYRKILEKHLGYEVLSSVELNP